MKKNTSPEHTKQVENCTHQSDGARYAEELNHLLHKRFPDIEKNEILEIVTELTSPYSS